MKNLTKITTLLFLCICPDFVFGQFVKERAPESLPITKPENSVLSGKGIFGISLNGGASYDNINSGILAVNEKDTSNKKEVMLGPGGGLGLEIYGGKQYTPYFRLGIRGGFQYASGTPEIKDATIRFLKYYVIPEVNFSIPFLQRNSIELGLGLFASFGNSLLIKAPKGVNFKQVEISYKPNIGAATHLYYQRLITEKAAFFGGLRFHWVNLEVSEITIGSSQATLTPSGEKQYNNKNGGGVALVFGFNFFF